MIWLDGLDSPLVRMLEAGFDEPYEETAQPVGEGADPSVAKYGAWGCGRRGNRRPPPGTHPCDTTRCLRCAPPWNSWRRRRLAARSTG
jgi:hypothetical protein